MVRNNMDVQITPEIGYKTLGTAWEQIRNSKPAKDYIQSILSTECNNVIEEIE